MPRMFSTPYVPPAVPRDTSVPRGCKRSCCWSPYGHIVRSGCHCHNQEETS